MLIGKSLHLHWEELACKDGTPYPSKFITDGRVIELVVMFERIRDIWQLPLTILSAYRTVSHNKKVSGAKNSMHLQGKALDLMPPGGVSITEFYKILYAQTKELGIRGIGKYSTFVHVDTRESKELVTW